MRPQRCLYAPWKWRIPLSASPGGGRQSSRRGAAFGLHPFRRGTRRTFRCGRTLCTYEARRRRIRGETRRAPPPGALRAARPTPSGAGSAEARRGGGARPADRRAPGGGLSEGRVIAPRPAARRRRTRCEPQGAASMAEGGVAQDATLMPRLSSGTPCAVIGFRRKASCRASLDARRGTRRADWTGVRPPGLRAQPGAGIARRCERADGRAPGGEADLSPQPPHAHRFAAHLED